MPRSVVTVLCSLLLLPASSVAEVGTVSRSTELRERPSRIGKVIDTLSAGAAVEIRTRRGYWLQVEVSGAGTTGWVRTIRVRRGTSTKGRASSASKPGSGSSFFSTIARSATGLVSGSQGSRAPRQTTTIGIRGLSAQALTTAEPNLRALEQLAFSRSSADRAKAFARAADLKVQEVAHHAETSVFSLDRLRSFGTTPPTSEQQEQDSERDN